MSTPSEITMDTGDASAQTPAPPRPTQPFVWSVRRELWEYRAVFTAPLIAAGVTLFGFLLGGVHVSPQARGAILALDPAKRQMLAFVPYAVAALAIMTTGLILTIVYSLGTLHNERRDRSILFWKSLPVSDVATVLSKASIPLVIQPFVEIGRASCRERV